MTTLENIFDLGNLRRAYRWILSNPDARYKAFFRDSYDAFAIASNTHLKLIRDRCLSEKYEASHASKILVPKPSGAIRPITLLTVEDQIVYQACINVVAEVLKRRTHRRYDKRIFAHLYAGKSSPFFYRRWQSSYQKFARVIKSAYAKGFDYIADFDLASFYDSIDHSVLNHFLRELEIDEDTIIFLLDCLKVWTSSTWSNGPPNIYHEHGIPQGPLASGMLSEAVLQHIDIAGEQGSKTIYLRYVDDIKILARSELELRRKLIKLDIAAREIGLFPQTSKINIHRISDPMEEIKSVSSPPEPSLRPKTNQKKLATRLLELTRNGQLDRSTVSRFKYLLAHAEPTYRLNSRLMQVMRRHPDLADNICAYIAKYNKLPAKITAEIVTALKEPELYHAVNASLLRATLGKLDPLTTVELAQFAVNRLLSPPIGSIRLQASYKEALVACAIRAGILTFAEFEKFLLEEKDWWVRKSYLRELQEDRYGRDSYAALINLCLRMEEGEVARMAASIMLRDSVRLSRPYGDVEITAKQALKVAGIVKTTAGQKSSRINEIIAYILGRNRTDYDWRRFFGKDHRHTEVHAVFLKRNRETNIDAFLVQLDSFCDSVTRELWRRLKPPGSKCPNFGHAIKDGGLTAALPRAMTCFIKLHDLRLQSATAHPRTKTGLPTRRLKHRDFYKLRRELIEAFDDIETSIIP